MRHWLRFLQRHSWDQERARELQSHLDLEIERNIERGMSEPDAVNAAYSKLGNIARIREEVYQMNTIGAVENLWRDLRYAVRSYRASPGFTSVALLSLMLGIGATTAIFSVIYGVLISPYPYAKPGEIWAPMLRETKTSRIQWPELSIQELAELQKLPGIGTAMGTQYDSASLAGDRSPENLTAPRLTPAAFDFLGVPALAGRTIQPADIGPDGQPQPVTVISYKLWQRLFSGSPDAIGKTLILDRTPHTIIGVMPPRFGWYTDDGLWRAVGTASAPGSGTQSRLFTILRLKTGVAPKVAEEQLQRFYAQIQASTPDRFPKEGFTPQLRNYLDMTVASGELQSNLMLLLSAVAFLLLIACANVANLQLARTAARTREIGLRLSIGGSRRRILGQLLTESIVLALAGGLLGIGLAFGLTKLIATLLPSFYTPNEARITLNVPVLLFSFTVAVLTGVLFGLVPAIQCSRQNLTQALRERTQAGGSGAGGTRTRSILVISEVALSVVLLVAAAVAIRSFMRVQQLDLGFNPDNVLSAGLPLPRDRYQTLESRNLFAGQLLERVRALPGVTAANIGNGGMPFYGPGSRFTINGQPVQGVERINCNAVGESYLEAMGARLLRGRELTEAEVATGRRVALINETAARLWPSGQDPVGRQIAVAILAKSPDPSIAIWPGPAEVTIVGVIRNTRNAGLSSEPNPAIYFPYTLIAPGFRQIIIRTQGDPMQFANVLRREVQAIDSEQALQRPQPFTEILDQQAAQPRFNMALFGLFGGIGILLAATGIFSVISYSVAQRTHEIGVRVALGARQTDISGLVVGMGAKLVAIGIGIGLAGTIVLVRVVQTQVFDLALFDATSGAAVIALLATVGLLACYLPARRAARLNPMVALRQD
ncbi:MAG: ABC transporter permease [Bryobacteraceae bacterium]|nr:ABC transporter permease [Bryobacteraceae bacterium]